MSVINAKRIMIAAAGSHSGKTTITCALLKALSEKGYRPVSFKCGPDYIDPLFHKKVLGVDSRNLDTFLAGREGIKEVFSRCGDGFAVIEGVMGIFDGNSPESTEGSCYEVAQILDTPIVLVVDASGMGRTVISLIKGILSDDRHQLIKGIILNKISEGFYRRLLPVLEKELSLMGSDVRVLGFFPKNEEISIGSRHLGLMLPGEILDLKKKITLAAEALSRNVNLESLLGIMRNALPIEYNDKEDLVYLENMPSQSTECGKGLTLAVAYDEAFCFYYRENLELFQKEGVEISFFSPLRDEKLPEKCDGILLGGGYPENYLKELSANKSMLSSIRNAVDREIPSLAECGGFMYLHERLTDISGESFCLAGVIKGECQYTGHLVRFGYMQIESFKGLGKGNDSDPLLKGLVGMRGHEFHYYDSTMNGVCFTAGKPGKDITWDCMVSARNGIWGFPHFYYGSDPMFVRMFIERMKEVKNG
jgi:cobyrinic acid a,c-diamide synthase